MNIKSLLLGTSLSLIPNLTYAQCAVTDCLQLGYTSLQKCDNGLKCPFGEYWACPKAEEKAVLGQCTGYAKNCSVGQILNSDGACTTDRDSGKTPIGVIVYIGGNNCGQALALNDLGEMNWGNYNTSPPDLPIYQKISTAEQDFDSCGNTQKFIKYGNSSTYPAAWAAINYAPSSVSATKGKWCLPAAGVARSMMNNYDKINTGLSKAGGETLPTKTDQDHWNWSSSMTYYYHYRMWSWNYSLNTLDILNNNMSTYHVRPVLEF